MKKFSEFLNDDLRKYFSAHYNQIFNELCKKRTTYFDSVCCDEKVVDVALYVFEKPITYESIKSFGFSGTNYIIKKVNKNSIKIAKLVEY